MPRQVIFHELHDAEWLRARYVVEGVPMKGIARLIGCSDVAVSHAMKRHGVERPPGWTPPPVEWSQPLPEREFVRLAERLGGPLADLDVDVPTDELERRMREGLTDLAELARLAGELPRDRLWGLVVERVDAATARAAVFSAAVLASEQAGRSTEVAAPSARIMSGG